MSFDLLHSFYYGNSLNKNELAKLQDFLQRALWQVNKQLYELNQIIEEDSLICPKCKTDDYISYDLAHSEDDIPYDVAYCEKCKITVWEEEHE